MITTRPSGLNCGVIMASTENEMNLNESCFYKDLKALLRKYNAELEIDGDDHYAYHGGAHINAWAYAEYEDGEVVKEQIDINLGNWINGDV